MKTQFMAVLLCLFSYSFTLNAHESELSGVVFNDQNAPLAYATIALLNAVDSTLIKGAYSDEAGKYVFNQLPAGDYIIKYAFIGMEDQWSDKIQLTEKETRVLPPMTLREAGNELKTVTITYKKPLIEVKADKTVFNVEGSSILTNTNALDLLRKAPGVVVDKDDNITLKGKSGIQVYIDNKPTQLDATDLAVLLKSIQSGDIEAIELITNPSAKYDAAGSGGIINIRLKKNKAYGTNANINLGLSYGITPKLEGSLGFNHRNKKVNVFGNVSHYRGQYENVLNLYRIQNDTIYDQHGVNINSNNNYNFKLGTDYQLNDRHTLGFLVNGNIGKGDWSSSSKTHISDQATTTLQKVLIASNEIPDDRFRVNYNINYRFADTSGTVLTMDFDYGQFRNRANSYQPNYYKDPTENITLEEKIYRNNTPLNIDIYTAKSDYEFPLLKGKGGAGIKSAFVKTDNSFQFFDVVDGQSILDETRSNHFVYTENVNAAYLNYNRQWQKWSIQAGLRAEQTISHGVLESMNDQGNNDVKRNYLDFFPSAGITYSVNEKHQLGLNYTRRIDRPSYQDLNPFENKLDELTYEKGNAFLQPQYSQNLELSHTYNYSLTTTIAYSHTTDIIVQIIDTIRGNASFITQQNLAEQDIAGLNISSPLPLAKWWNGYLSLGTNYVTNYADFGPGKQQRLSIWSVNMYQQHTFSLPKGWSLELSGWYNSPTVWGTLKTKAMASIDAGLKKSILRDKGNLSIALSDIFLTQKWSGISDFGGVYLNASGRRESRQLKVNFSYRFGNTQVKAVRQHKSGMEEEQGRIKSDRG